MEIKPRKISDRGGIITMPLKANVPDPMINRGRKQTVQNVELYVGNALSPKDSAKICLTEECVLCVH